LSATADLLLVNARVLTLDPARPSAEAIAIEGNRILALGTNAELDALNGVGTVTIDCDGMAVLPGFNDAHCHPLAMAASRLSVDCSPLNVRTIPQLQDQIRRRANSTPPGQWIRATGYNEFYLAEQRHPNRRDLDQATAKHPVRLTHRSGHACVLNSWAMAVLGIGTETPEPPGAIIDRDLETGEPSGLLFEMNTYVEEHIPPLSDQDLRHGMEMVNRDLLQHGVTSLQDAGWTDGHGRWETLALFRKNGVLLPRASMMIGPKEVKDFRETHRATGEGADRSIGLGAIKIVLSTATGSLAPPQEELNELVYRAHVSGLQVALHAIEESEVEAAVSSLEYALSQNPARRHRHRVEHCSVCPPNLTQRLGAVQAIVATQPSFVYYSGERYLATVSPRDMEHLYPIGSLVREGVLVAAGSDAPVAPIQPLAGICAAVTRAAQSGQILLPGEAITVEQAIEMHTLNGAYASFEENEKGRLAPGLLADLVVLDRNPADTASEDIKDIEVVLTIIDGRVAWEG